MSTKSCITNIIIVDDGAGKWVIIDNLHVNVKNKMHVWFGIQYEA